MKRAALAASLLLVLGVGLCCAPGNHEWRRESYNTAVGMPGAGDGQCSPPAPWILFPSCKVHDLAYERARRVRCEDGDPEEYSRQARFVADTGLYNALAQDGYGDLIATPYFWAVRGFGWIAWGGWWTSCETRAPPD